MMWPGSLKPPVAVATAFVLAIAVVAVQGRQQPAPGGTREHAKTTPPPTAAAHAAGVPEVAANRALAREQLVLIDEVLAILHDFARHARISLSDPAFSLWGRRKLETLRKTGAGKAEIVAALEKDLDILKQEEALVEARKEMARGTQLDVYDVRFRRIEAEIWLNEEKAR